MIIDLAHHIGTVMVFNVSRAHIEELSWSWSRRYPEPWGYEVWNRKQKILSDNFDRAVQKGSRPKFAGNASCVSRKNQSGGQCQTLKENTVLTTCLWSPPHQTFLTCSSCLMACMREIPTEDIRLCAIVLAEIMIIGKWGNTVRTTQEIESMYVYLMIEVIVAFVPVGRPINLQTSMI